MEIYFIPVGDPHDRLSEENILIVETSGNEIPLEGIPCGEQTGGLRELLQVVRSYIIEAGFSKVKITKDHYIFEGTIGSFVILKQPEAQIPRNDLFHAGEVATIKDGLGLLAWHLGPKMYSHHPGARGATQYCVDCKSVLYPGEANHNPLCPSHEKWARVFGRPFTPPPEERNPIIEKFKEKVRQAEKAAKKDKVKT